MDDGFLTTVELAAALRVNRRTILRWVSGKQIPFVRITGTTYRFKLAEVLAWLKANPDAAKA